MGCIASRQTKNERVHKKNIEREIQRSQDDMTIQELRVCLKDCSQLGIVVEDKDYNDEFYLDFRSKLTKILILALRRQRENTSHGRIPNMRIVRIIKMLEPKDSRVKYFLINHMPRNVDKFYFDQEPKFKDKEIGYYQFELFKCLPRISKVFKLCGFKLK
mmetsp:Transcript_3301/g.3032  ORF Transcript_3301/g.3032 Transcript_3301/m.3032 type:complete len:160 (-) Transcript_3301:1029-1508(-)